MIFIDPWGKISFIEFGTRMRTHTVHIYAEDKLHHIHTPLKGKEQRIIILKGTDQLGN